MKHMHIYNGFMLLKHFLTTALGLQCLGLHQCSNSNRAY